MNDCESKDLGRFAAVGKFAGKLMKIRSKSAPKLVLESLLLLFILAPQTFAADEEKLKKAIELVNKGNSEEALPLLKELARENPADERVLRTLGHVYRSRGEYGQAIDLFEKAAQIKPSEGVYYSLGMLYEAMSVHPSQKSDEMSWLKKARDAWNSFLKMNPADSRRVEVAKRHLKHIEQQFKESD